MTSILRGAVSKKKKRFKEDGFDLDLSYITPRIVAMGFPSEGKEGLYRNPISEVQRFYEKRHKDSYKLYNLCAERVYDHSKFHDRVSHYPFEDHNAPPIQLIVDCCKDVENWLKKDEKHVVGINCKAGKGRTGLIICCYLLHSEVVKTSDDALKYYGARRTKDGKGVTIASQQRYIRYYEQVLKLGKVPEPRLLRFKKVKVHTVPNFPGDPYVTLVIKGKETYSSKPVTIGKKATGYEIDCDAPCYGDVKVQFAMKKGGSSQKICHFWFNTAFISKETNSVELVKSEIDVANKDKKNAHFKPEFKIEIFFDEIETDDQKTIVERRDSGTKKADKKKKKEQESSSSTASDAEVTSPKKGKGKANGTTADSNEKETKSSPKSPASEVKNNASSPPDSPSSGRKAAVADKDKTKKNTNGGDKKAPKEGNNANGSATEDFEKKRKRAQSFYDIAEEDEDLSDSELDEKEMEAYFEEEKDDDDDEDEDDEEGNNNNKKASKKKLNDDVETSGSKGGKSSPTETPPTSPKDTNGQGSKQQQKPADKKEVIPDSPSASGDDSDSKSGDESDSASSVEEKLAKAKAAKQQPTTETKKKDSTDESASSKEGSESPKSSKKNGSASPAPSRKEDKKEEKKEDTSSSSTPTQPQKKSSNKQLTPVQISTPSSRSDSPSRKKK